MAAAKRSARDRVNAAPRMATREFEAIIPAVPTPMITLGTHRLILRMFRESDLDAYAAMWRDPDVMRFVGDGYPLSRAEAWRNIALILGHWQLRGFGLWAVEERTTGILVGRVGCWRPEGWPGMEIGWGASAAVLGPWLCHRGGAYGNGRCLCPYGAQPFDQLDPAGKWSFDRRCPAPRYGQEGSTEIMGHPALVYGVERSNPPGEQPS